MTSFWRSKLAIGIATVAISCSVVLGAPAEASNRTMLSNSSATATTEVVKITQQGMGSYFAVLEWPVVLGATEYRIYKTGTIRPKWRLFAYVVPTLNYWTVSDRPGAIAIYRLMAVINNTEVLMGRVIYIPRR